MSFMNTERHIFALYLKNVSQDAQYKAVGDTIAIHDKLFGSRVITVLRLGVGDQLIIFDEQINVLIKIDQVDTKKNSIRGVVQEINSNTSYEPEIILYQCLTQKTAFEEIMYSATQMGVIRVVPVISAKVQRKFDPEKERERLHKIMISAAEQSKNFVFPVLEDPVKISDLLEPLKSFETPFGLLRTSGQDNFKKQNERVFNAACPEEQLQSCVSKDLSGSVHRIFFSAGGAPLLGFLNECSQDIKSPLNVLIGCEGGLTEQEEQRLMEVGWKSYKLTPAILRAVDAVVVGLGVIRSVLS